MAVTEKTNSVSKIITVKKTVLRFKTMKETSTFNTIFASYFIFMVETVHLIFFIIVFLGVVTSQLLTFEGQLIHVKGGEILMLTCSCTYVPEECTMEFLHNNATAEILRKFDNVCYSTDKLCNPRECSCNEDCKSYSWNLTSSSVKKDDSFGCGMRVENTTYNTKIYLTLKYNGSG